MANKSESRLTLSLFINSIQHCSTILIAAFIVFTPKEIQDYGFSFFWCMHV